MFVRWKPKAMFQHSTLVEHALEHRGSGKPGTRLRICYYVLPRECHLVCTLCGRNPQDEKNRYI
ncbi:unnamed protein product [Orchesella dallaii]|uniref:Uncharacterized protein n=1 Tax=Orchesella dallaii TaxID=48710 RepID=A0ABP1PVN7_9HEXA